MIIMKGETAVEWLEKIYNDRGYILMSEYFEQAKEKEKQQKDVDYQNGYLDCYAKLMSERLTRDI